MIGSFVVAQELDSPDATHSDSNRGRPSLSTAAGVAGVAAASLGAAVAASGLAIDITDVALLAGLYGVASTVNSSRSADIRSKGAAGPFFSALVSAADIARRIRGGQRAGVRAVANPDIAAPPPPSRFERSATADQSAAASARNGDEPAGKVSSTGSAVAASLEDEALESRVAARADAMRAQLGPSGLAALEDGVAQVVASDVARILTVRLHACSLASLSCNRDLRLA